MTKQEQIQEGIDEKRETILNFIRAWGVIKHPYGSRDAEGCLAQLAEMGLVLKVDPPYVLYETTPLTAWVPLITQKEPPKPRDT